MSLQSNLWHHLLHKSSTPATHKVRGSTCQHVQGIKRSDARPRKHRLTCQPCMLRQAVPTSNNQGKQGTCTRMLLLGERKSLKHEPSSKVSTQHRRSHWPDHCISTLLHSTAAAAAATPSSSFVLCSLQRDPEGPSQPHVSPGTQPMSRL